MTVFNFDASGFLRRTSSRKVVIQIPLRKVMKTRFQKIWYPKYETCKYRRKGTSFRKYGIQNMKHASIDVRAPVSENIFAKWQQVQRKLDLDKFSRKWQQVQRGLRQIS